jgi:hypothetical protein
MTDQMHTLLVLLTISISGWPWCIRHPQRRFEEEVSSAIPSSCTAEQDERKVFNIAIVFQEKRQKLCRWHFVDCWQCFSLLSCVISSFLCHSFLFLFASPTSSFMAGVLLVRWGRIGGFSSSLLLLRRRGSLGIASFLESGPSSHASIRLITASSRKVRHCFLIDVIDPDILHY